MKNKLLIIILLLLGCLHIKAIEPPRVIHAFVALCDNVHQGIVPVPVKLGNGDDPRNNLYWGAMYGVKRFFKRSQNWTLVQTGALNDTVLERSIFRHKKSNTWFVADAYRGRDIKQAIFDFLSAASGSSNERISVQLSGTKVMLNIQGHSDLAVYIGHDGLMDFNLKHYPVKQDKRVRDTIILACLSKRYFNAPISKTGAHPILWTTGLMAPEAYTLEAALEGWVLRESDNFIRDRAAKAYHHYQQCGMKAAKRLLVTGY